MAPFRDAKRTASTSKTSTEASLAKSENNLRRHNHHRKSSSLDGAPTSNDIVDPHSQNRQNRRGSRAHGRNPHSRAKRKMHTNHLPPPVDANPSDRSGRHLKRSGEGESPPAGGSEGVDDNEALTKTGRISRALKGKPVHKCDVCDKVYTRNEHLRRHQLNHSAQALKCDVSGCDKTFHRTDLLIRHKEEHFVRESVSGDESVRRSNSARTYQESPPSSSLNPLGAAQAHKASIPPDNTGLGISPGLSPLRHPSYPTTTEFESCAAGQHLQGPYFVDNRSLNSSPRPFQSPVIDSSLFGSLSSTQPGYSFPVSTTLGTDDWFPVDPSGSRSPVSTSSSSIHQPWLTTNKSNSFRHTVSPTGSDISRITGSEVTAFGRPPVVMNDFDQVELFPGPAVFSDLDAFEEQMILKELASLTFLPREPDGRVYLTSIQEPYLEAYWRHFHPMFAVMHKPSFDTFNTSPLVKSIMIAIGAQYFDDEQSQTISRCLRETCLALLQRRPHVDYRLSRLWDLQATFLAEAFSLYCSRRPSSHFSPRFEDLLAGLVTDPDNMFSANPLEVLNGYMNFPDDSISEPYIQWIHLESKRRLLLACYILEVQQKSMFGSPRPVSDKNLPQPCSRGLWEAHPSDMWLVQARQEVVENCPLSDALTYTDCRQSSAGDSFSSNIVIAFYTHGMLADGDAPTPDIVGSIEQSPRCIFSWHAALLAANTPVHDLLAVSGESFLLGHKLPTSDMFQQAVGDLRSWVADGRAEAALQHALQILKMAMQNGRFGLMHEDWSLALAALVCWACALWPMQREAQARLAVDTRREQQAALAAQNAMQHTAAGGVHEQIDWRGARACLAWVKDRIERRIGWLNQDAAGTLSKLLDGRQIEMGQ